MWAFARNILCGLNGVPRLNKINSLSDFRLEKGQNPEQLLEVVTSLLKWLATPEQAGLRRAFTVWFNRVLQAGPANAQENITSQFQELTEVRTMLAETVKEWHRQWKQEGRKEGREEGIKIGEEKGRREGQTHVFLKLLELKFGPLSHELKAKIHSADTDLILKWNERILTVETLEEVFEDV